MACMQCKCGGVKLAFGTAKPVIAGFECCCVDCYSKNNYYCQVCVCERVCTGAPDVWSTRCVERRMCGAPAVPEG